MRRIPEAARDPVCGMAVDPAKTPHHHTVDGVTNHFCGARCRERFAADPQGVLAKAAAPSGHHHGGNGYAPGGGRAPASSAAHAPAGAADAEYACPMHYEIVPRTGSCLTSGVGHRERAAPAARGPFTFSPRPGGGAMAGSGACRPIRPSSPI